MANEKDRVSVIEDGVRCFGTVVKADETTCTVDFDDGDDGCYRHEEVTIIPERPTILGDRAEKRGDVPMERSKNQIKLVSKIPKRNTFMADKHRDERDSEVLNKAVGGREYRGKIKTITRVKHMQVSKDGFWVTDFIIDLLKE